MVHVHMHALQLCYNQPLFDNERKRCQNVNNKYCDPKVSPRKIYIEDRNYKCQFFYCDVDRLIGELMSVGARRLKAWQFDEKDRGESGGALIFR